MWADQSLGRKENRSEQGPPSFEHMFKTSTEWFNEQRDDDNKEGGLNGIRAHANSRESNGGPTGE